MQLNLISQEGRITTLEQLLRVSNISLEEREILKIKSNKWEVAMNKKDGSTELTELFQIFAELKPRSGLFAPDIKKILLETFKDSIPTIRGPIEKDGPLLCNINLADIHYGRINESKPKQYLQSIRDKVFFMFDRQLKWKPDKLLLVQLGDFFDAEMNGSTTSGKHSQHLSMPAKEMFKNGLQFHIDLIKALANELPTDVIMIPGNHDRNILFQTGEALQIYFNQTNNVKIDNTDQPRKYVKRGDNNIGFSHGDGEKQKDIIKIFSDEFGIKKHNYHYRGHFHESEQKAYGPLIVETLSSPAIQSDWEKNKFASKSGKLVSNLFDKKKGLINKIYA